MTMTGEELHKIYVAAENLTARSDPNPSHWCSVLSNAVLALKMMEMAMANK